MSGPSTVAPANVGRCSPGSGRARAGTTRSPTAAIASVIRPPAATPWSRAGDDELGEVLRDAAQRPRRRGTRECACEQPLAAVPVAELAPQRRRGGGGDDVGGDEPGDVAEAAEVGGDGRQRGGQDRLVEDRAASRARPALVLGDGGGEHLLEADRQRRPAAPRQAHAQGPPTVRSRVRASDRRADGCRGARSPPRVGATEKSAPAARSGKAARSKDDSPFWRHRRSRAAEPPRAARRARRPDARARRRTPRQPPQRR